MKLPKQFKHWLQAANLRLYRRNRFYKPALTEFRGRGRHWRINCHGELQCSEPYKDFDRWANSVAASTLFEARTREEFLAAIKELERLAT